ncbi:MAG: hypothetical protein CO129_12170 [Ignavibacteriales bacterium CG_4_9_14_3_um_filter_34_10]|nr:MAG: hypothetical protein CO129_12170 [Ignavibacteriales bacterium CG_4_9_14_3_um_filter_34_10]
MSGVSIKKVIKDVHHLLKTTKPKNSRSSYWELLKEQAFSEGTWDDNFITEIKNKILSQLEKFNAKEIKKLWDESDASIKNLVVEESLTAAQLKDDVSEEILNTVFDSLDERNFSEPIFQSDYVAEEGDDDALDPDELDGFSDDSNPPEDEDFDANKL